MSKVRFSWRKAPPTSRYRGAPTRELWRGGERLAIAQGAGGDKWFWYTVGLSDDCVNTAGRPDTLDAVKAEAVAHFKSKLSHPQT